MIVNITPEMSPEETRKKLAELKPARKFDMSKHFGKLNWAEDPVAYQRRLRDE